MIFDAWFMLPHLDLTDNFQLGNKLNLYFMHGLTHVKNIDKISYRAVGHILMVPGTHVTTLGESWTLQRLAVLNLVELFLPIFTL